MAEFQFFEFAKVDRPLTEAEKGEINSWSSRTAASNYRAIFTYSYADFGQDERQVVTDFFDAMYYYANWGSVRFMMKFPNDLVDFKILQQFDLPFEGDYYGEGINIIEIDDSIIIDIYFNQDGGSSNWFETEGVLDTLLPIRKQILDGDYRALYLAWLHFASLYWEIDLDEDDELLSDLNEIIEPPLPANLKKPNNALEQLIEAFEMNERLINRVANDSPFEDKPSIDYEALLSNLSKSEKDEFLMQAINGEVNVGHKIRQKLKAFMQEETSNKKTSKRRTLIEMTKLYGKI